MLTPEQTQTGLAVLIGGGGISSVLVAFFGFLSAARSGRPPEDKPIVAFNGTGGVTFDHEVAQHLGTIAFALLRLVAIKEIEAEQETSDKGFRDRLEGKIDRLLVDSVRSAAAQDR